MCRPRMMSRQPVAVTKMLPRGGGLVHGRHLEAFHGRLQAQIGSISVISTRAP